MSEFFDRWGKKPKDKAGADERHGSQRDSMSSYSRTLPTRQHPNPTAATPGTPPAMPPRPTSNASPPHSRSTSEYGGRNSGSFTARSTSRASQGIYSYALYQCIAEGSPLF
jgi:hypothetical protein